MNQVLLSSKHSPWVYEASPTELMEYSEQAGVDVVPLEFGDFLLPGIGYCALSLLEKDDGTFTPDKVVGFVSHHGAIQHNGVWHDQVRHLTVLPEWGGMGLACSLVGRVTRGLEQAGSEHIAAVVNAQSKGVFVQNGYYKAGTILGLTGVYKSLYVYQSGYL